MTIILAALAVSFAAFCIWLAVRIYNRRERWAKWVAGGLVVVFIIYPLSIGPACWLVDRSILPPDPTRQAFRPVVFVLGRCPDTIQRFAIDYVSIAATNDFGIGLGGDWIIRERVHSRRR